MRHLILFILAIISCPGMALGVGMVGLELNKTEPDGEGCRIYLLTDNQSGLAFGTFTLEMVLFDKAGVIHRNMGLDIAPLPRDKKMVLAFNVKDTQCGEIGSILVNQIMQCEAEAGATPDCMSLLSLSTRADIAVMK